MRAHAPITQNRPPSGLSVARRPKRFSGGAPRAIKSCMPSADLGNSSWLIRLPNGL